MSLLLHFCLPFPLTGIIGWSQEFLGEAIAFCWQDAGAIAFKLL
ncbi:hypothetical protein [Coleofasciculus sp. FACHB-129]|nr:hypothetical protein [Coleofasciculus sp. FACHB-129]